MKEERAKTFPADPKGEYELTEDGSPKAKPKPEPKVEPEPKPEPKAEEEPKPKHVHKSNGRGPEPGDTLDKHGPGSCYFCSEISVSRGEKPIPKDPTPDGIHQCRCRNELV